jgi:hypothetical protein
MRLTAAAPAALCRLAGYVLRIAGHVGERQIFARCTSKADARFQRGPSQIAADIVIGAKILAGSCELKI